MVPLEAARKSTWPQAALDRKWPQVEFWTSGSLGARVLGLGFGIEVPGAKLKGLRFWGLGFFWFFSAVSYPRGGDLGLSFGTDKS